MQVDAPISKQWRRRQLFLFFMIAGIAAYFLFDGYYAWPREQQRYVEYLGIVDGLVASGEAENAESPSVERAWKRYAEAQGYADDVPEERTDAAIGQQRWIGGVMMTGSLIFVAWIAWNHRLRIRVDGDEITGASGQLVHLDSIVAIDRKKWDNKGIAYAIYEVDGKRGRLCIDAHKFAGSEAIVDEADRRIKARKDSPA